MTVFVTQYFSFGGRRPGGIDDIAGTIAQIPGWELSYHELDLAANGGSGDTLQIDPEAAFIEFSSDDSDFFFNFDDDGYTSIAAGNRAPGYQQQIRYAAVVDGRSPNLLKRKFNVKEKT